MAMRSSGALDSDAIVTPSTHPQFGDYQANGIMKAAKYLCVNPRGFAQKVVGIMDLNASVSTFEVAGPGFINITLSNKFLEDLLTSPALIEPAEQRLRVVVDYSSPNLAKELHVGHLRSTVIGDSMSHTLEFAGYEVIRQNHVGDWGTPFGRLITYLSSLFNEQEFATIAKLEGLEKFYVEASKRFDNDPEFADAARQAVVRLQSGDPETLKKWRKVLSLSIDHMQNLYQRLGISLGRGDIRGESAYSKDLPSIIEDLQAARILSESDGALCVFVEGFQNKDGNLLPMLVRKSDGGYLYHTTDMAAIRYRAQKLAANRVLYFTDSRQILHFQLLFAVAEMVGYTKPKTKLEHHPFGKITDSSGKPFKSRDGSSIPLMNLLDEGEERARKIVELKSGHLSTAEQHAIARDVAIGAIKYADLSKNRLHDYVFDWDTMLSFEGNTAPYLQYAYARLQSIFSRGSIEMSDNRGKQIQISEAEERTLALQLIRFQEVIDLVCAEAKPHYLCTYLYDLTSKFMRFYEECPVLNAETSIKGSRLAMCVRVSDTISTGLNCLGIPIVSRM